MKTVEERFWSYVDVRGKDECWDWLRGRTTNGYGQMKVGGVKMIAHRLAWEFRIGQIPECNGSAIDLKHSCGNKLCCNADHLYLNTVAVTTCDFCGVSYRPWGNVVHDQPNHFCCQDHFHEWSKKAQVHTDALGYRIFRRKGEHRIVWESIHGEIPAGFHIHHKDRNPGNNDIGNLEMLTYKEHSRVHSGWIRDEQRNWTHKPCSKCKKLFPVVYYSKDHPDRTRSYCDGCSSQHMKDYRKSLRRSA